MTSEISSTNSICSIPAGTQVLLTGASGFTGTVLAKKLVQCGLRVRAIARESSNISALADLPIDWIRGEVYDPETVAAAAKDVSYVFHLAAAYRTAGLSDDIYQMVHVESTRLLARACLENKNFKRFVHVSTVGVHGHIERPPADENYRFAPGDVYQETKAKAEIFLREFAAANNLPFTVIRPAAIYGPGDKRLLKIFKMAARPIYPIVGNGKCLYHLIHVEDLTNAIICAANHPAAKNEVFICGDEQSSSLPEMARVIAESLGRQTRPLRIPAWPIFLLADVCEAVCKVLKISPPIYRRRVAFYTKDRAFDTKKIRKLLGYKPIYTAETGLRELSAWYLQQGWLR